MTISCTALGPDLELDVLPRNIGETGTSLRFVLLSEPEDYIRGFLNRESESLGLGWQRAGQSGAARSGEGFRRSLRELRKKRGFSQEGLAIESEYDRSYMGRLERGEANPSLRMIFALCKLLRVKPSELLN
jgi:DNA-binding XRE family transcriptional regulator